MVRTSVTHSAAPSCANFFLFLPHFDVICDLLLNRHTATWNLLILLNGCMLIINNNLAIEMQLEKLELHLAISLV